MTTTNEIKKLYDRHHHHNDKNNNRNTENPITSTSSSSFSIVQYWYRSIIFAMMTLFAYSQPPKTTTTTKGCRGGRHSCKKYLNIFYYFIVIICCYNMVVPIVYGITSSSASSMLVVRVRIPDGSIQKVMIPSNQINTMSLQDVLKQVHHNDHDDDDDDEKVENSNNNNSEEENKEEDETNENNINNNNNNPKKQQQQKRMIQMGTTTIHDTKQTLQQLGIKHGTLISIRSSTKDPNQNPEHTSTTTSGSCSSSSRPKSTISSRLASKDRSSTEDTSGRREVFVPYPDLAKNYGAVLEKVQQQQQQNKNSKNPNQKRGGSSSYQVLADLSSELHRIEVQNKGMIQRLYMCTRSAQLFHQQCSSDQDNSNKKKKNHAALLFGTIQKELIDCKPKPKTSLSSRIKDDEYCTIAKVHAMYEPPENQIQRKRNNSKKATTKKKKKKKNQQTVTNQDEPYDANSLLSIVEYKTNKMNQGTLDNNDNTNDNHENTGSSGSCSSSVLRVAHWLGLQPVGWIFSYSDVNHHEDEEQQNNNNNMDSKTNLRRCQGDEDTLPVLPFDIYYGAKLQIEKMKHSFYNDNDAEENDKDDDDDNKKMKQSNQSSGNSSSNKNRSVGSTPTKLTKKIDQPKQQDNGASPFCTLAMDAITGSTEAFQLSDITVQMISEDMFLVDQNQQQEESKVKENTSQTKQRTTLSSSSSSKTKTTKSISPRHVVTKYPVLIDGKEHNEFDTVLCLVNTALLAYPVGLFSGRQLLLSSSSHDHPMKLSTKRTNGKLTTRTKKALLRAIDKTINQYHNNNNNSNHGTVTTIQQQPQPLFELLCDFHVLVALDEILTLEDSKVLCLLVRKYARGQKQSTMLTLPFLTKLHTMLEHY